MNPTRREVFQAGVAGAVTFVLGGCNADGAALAGPGVTPLPKEATGTAAETLSLATFTPRIGSRFVFADALGARTSMTLLSATDLGIGDRPVLDQGECFALSFATDAEAPLGQDTYLASHAVLGEFPLFLVPGALAPRRTYSAIINRL
ncbi:MAG TPA: hypothetical protein VH062_00205 [Polyangiaceae bacterium]|jgi:hypothetical protein|nr:hypothetical protein [Polyangiaceae bacterium]